MGTWQIGRRQTTEGTSDTPLGCDRGVGVKATWKVLLLLVDKVESDMDTDLNADAETK